LHQRVLRIGPVEVNAPLLPVQLGVDYSPLVQRFRPACTNDCSRAGPWWVIFVTLGPLISGSMMAGLETSTGQLLRTNPDSDTEALTSHLRTQAAGGQAGVGGVFEPAAAPDHPVEVPFRRNRISSAPAPLDLSCNDSG
jgi:hypothetical protein